MSDLPALFKGVKIQNRFIGVVATYEARVVIEQDYDVESHSDSFIMRDTGVRKCSLVLDIFDLAGLTPHEIEIGFDQLLNPYGINRVSRLYSTDSKGNQRLVLAYHGHRRV